MQSGPPLATWILAFVSIFLSASAQLLMKIGMSAIRARPPAGLSKTAVAVALNPQVIGGLACYGVSAVLWLAVLSRMPLSMAYPLVALAIVLVIGASYFVLGESLPPYRLAGAALIVAGVAAIGLKG